MNTNTEREELIEILWFKPFPYGGRAGEFMRPDANAAHAMADAILAAGYRKPRTITTVEELDALPSWSVVRSEQATVWEKFNGSPAADFWAETMTLGQHLSKHIALPATVLYTPEPTK